MTAEIHIKVVMHSMEGLNMSKDLEVSDIPGIEQDGLAEPGENKCDMLSKMMSSYDLHPVASWTRA